MASPSHQEGVDVSPTDEVLADDLLGPRRREPVFPELLVVLVGMFALVVAAQLLLRLVDMAGFVQSLVSVLTYGLMLVFLLLVVRRHAGRLGELLGLTRQRPIRQLGAGLVVASVLLALIVGLPLLCGVPAADIAGSSNGSVASLILSVVFSLVLVGPIEELIFRGYLLGRLRQRMRPMPAVLLQAVIFGLWHFPASLSLVQVALTFVIGCLLGLVRWTMPHGTTLAVGVGHGVYDAALRVIAQLCA